MDESYVFPPPLTLLCPPSVSLCETTWLPTFPLTRNDQSDEIPPSPCLSMGTSTSSSTSITTISPIQTSYSPLHRFSTNKEDKFNLQIKLFPSVRSESEDLIRSNNESGAYSVNLTSTATKSTNTNITQAQEDKIRELICAKASIPISSRTIRLDHCAVDRLLRFESLANRMWYERDPMLSFPFDDSNLFREPMQKQSKTSLFGLGGESIPSSSSRTKMSNSFLPNSYSPIKKLKLLENNKLSFLLRPQKTKARNSSLYVFDDDCKFARSKSPSGGNLMGEMDNDVFSTWGGMAKALWGEESIRMEDMHVHHQQQQQQQQQHQYGIRLDKDVLAQLKDWDTFYTTYTLALFNFNDLPPLPKGVPIFDACPNASPTYLGMLHAPIPEWEGIRLQSFYRLGVLHQDKVIRERISDVLDEMQLLLPKLKIRLRYIDHDHVYLHSKERIYRESETGRRESVCAHTILNRNLGMQVLNFTQDWRFKLSENQFLIEDDDFSHKSFHINHPFKIDPLIRNYKAYAGTPIMAADGLPMGVLSVWGKLPGRKSENLNNFLRQNARKIATLLELSHCMNFVCKLEQMKTIYLNLPNYLSRYQPEIQFHHIGTRKVFQDAICARNGLFVVPQEGEKLFSVLVQIASVTNFTCVYLAAITLPWAHSIERRMDILAKYNETDERMEKLSYSFHERLFDSASEPYIVLQPSNCALESGGNDNVEINQEPFLCEEENFCQKPAGVFLAIKRNGKIGFVLGVLARRQDVVVGIEDLRFLQALQTNIEEAFTHFSHEFQERKKFPFKRALGTRKTHLSNESSIPAPQQFEKDLVKFLIGDETETKMIVRSNSLTSIRDLRKGANLARKSSLDERNTRLPLRTVESLQNIQTSIPSSFFKLQEEKDTNMYTIDETTWDVRMQSSQSTDTPTNNREDRLKRNRLFSSNELIHKNSTYQSSVEDYSGSEHKKSQQIVDFSSQDLSPLSATSMKHPDSFLSTPQNGLKPSPRINRPRAPTVSSADEKQIKR